MTHRFFVRGADVTPYHPANHTGTTNRRIIGPETVGATGVALKPSRAGTAAATSGPSISPSQVRNW